MELGRVAAAGEAWATAGAMFERCSGAAAAAATGAELLEEA
jgi:hypothetical protein